MFVFYYNLKKNIYYVIFFFTYNVKFTLLWSAIHLSIEVIDIFSHVGALHEVSCFSASH